MACCPAARLRAAPVAGAGGPAGLPAARLGPARRQQGAGVSAGRCGRRRQDPELVVVLARLEAAFGPVEVLEVRPNRRPARRGRPAGSAAVGGRGEETVQAVLDLDLDRREAVRRSPGAVDTR